MTTSTIYHKNDIIECYKNLETKKDLTLGIEWERSAIFKDSLKPVQYYGEKGYRAILSKLANELGWKIAEQDEKMIYCLKRGKAKITTEADGRIELTGSPNTNLHDLERELRYHANEIKEMSELFNIQFLPIGWQPFHDAKDIQMVPKKRYQRFLDMNLMEDMMKKDNGLTVNISYSDTGDAIQKARVAVLISPILSAMFASSPFDNGGITDTLSNRRKCIFNMAPGRCSVPERVLEDSFTISDWVEDYCTNIPVVYIKKNGVEYFPENLTFSQWIVEDYNGLTPTIDDFDEHIKSTWSDLRLRRPYLEYRVADSLPYSLAISVPALMKGLFLDPENFEKIFELTRGWSYTDILNLEQETWISGLKTEWKGKNFLWYAQELIQISNTNLHKAAVRNEQGQDETIYLIPLKEQIYIKEKSFAEEQRDLWNGEYLKDRARLLDLLDE